MSKRQFDSDDETDTDTYKKHKTNDTETDTDTDAYDYEDCVDLFDLFEQYNTEKHVIIKKDVKHITDLIEIGKEYDPTCTYNIDVKTLHRLVEPLTELNGMIGMETIKQEMVDHILYTIQDFDLYNKTMMHTVIEGPPGAGKTEVAKIIGKIYLAMGILRNDKFVKASRSQLIAGYLGQTAIATQKMIDMASGGVLFIDEVYSLGNSEKRDSFSKECIDTINENLTLRKTEFICIIAGYKQDIDQCFFAYNPGLERRFPIRFRIEEYNAKELFSIFEKNVNDAFWSMDDSITVSFFEKNYKEFAFFGGDIELLFNSCKRAHSRRVFTSDDTKKLVRLVDLEKGFESFLSHKKEKDVEKEHVWKSMYV